MKKIAAGIATAAILTIGSAVPAQAAPISSGNTTDGTTACRILYWWPGCWR